MENIFKKIQDTLTTNVPEVACIDMDEGQLDSYGEDIPVDYPCVLISFPEANFTNIGRGQQLGELAIQIKVALKAHERFNNKVPTEALGTEEEPLPSYHEQAFAHIAIVKKVMKALHTLEGYNFNSLVRKRWRKEKSPDPKIYTIDFECQYKDEEIGIFQGIEMMLEDFIIEPDFTA